MGAGRGRSAALISEVGDSRPASLNALPNRSSRVVRGKGDPRVDERGQLRPGENFLLCVDAPTPPARDRLRAALARRPRLPLHSPGMTDPRPSPSMIRPPSDESRAHARRCAIEQARLLTRRPATSVMAATRGRGSPGAPRFTPPPSSQNEAKPRAVERRPKERMHRSGTGSGPPAQRSESRTQFQRVRGSSP